MEGDVNRGGALTNVGISIHALRVEGDPEYLASVFLDTYISIHALRVEGDVPVVTPDADSIRISIHALRVEGDATICSIYVF